MASQRARRRPQTPEQPAGENESPAESTENPAENEQPAASTDGNTDQSTDGEGDGDGDSTSSDDEPTIERPEQSDTVETLPGTAEDNIEHIKGEDAEDQGETPETGKDEETPETPEEKTEEKTEEKAEETPEEKTEENPEEKPEETPAEDDADYSCAYDPDTGHFKITFNIKEDAEGDQTIELSKVQEVVCKSGEGYFDTEEGQKKLATAKMWGDDTMKYTYNGVTYIYTLATGTVGLYQEPGCTTVFDVSLSNGSRHTYVYKNNSLTVATPDMKNDDNTGVTGFDGQELPKEYTKKDSLELKYSRTAESGCMEDLVDAALKEFGGNHQQNQFLGEDGSLSTASSSTTVEAGTELVKIGNYYYVKSGDNYYGKISKTDKSLQINADGTASLVSDKKVSTLVYDNKGNKNYYYGPMTHQSSVLTNNDIRDALKEYMPAHGYETYDDYILDYYKKPDGTRYESVAELLKSDSKALQDLSISGSSMPEAGSNQNNTVGMDPSTLYDNFYKNVLSFKVGDPDAVDSEAGGNVDHDHSHGQWAADGTQETIGDYMAGKLNETPGAWAKANSYFNTLLANGMTADEATWAAFTMATNIDFQNAGNDYQDSAWNWYASMVLHQADGTLELTKTDADGNVIGDEEGEGQTSFYLWKYDTETDSDGNETRTPMYCTYVEPTYSTNDDGEQVLEKDGFYCWVKYDPAQDKMTYTITTTGGKLNIDYALLENVVYYLQEALAPEGYDADPNIYVICDKDTYDEMASSGAFDSVENPAEGSSAPVAGWLGAIRGGDTLTINFVNTASEPEPDPDPEPDPEPPTDPVDPENPDEPVSPENPDLPPVQDATPDPESPVLPQNPENPAVQDARPDAATLPQTGTTDWLAGVLMSFGSALLAGGWFFTRRQRTPKH